MSNPTMTEEEATKFFSEFYHGEHHFPSQLKQHGFGWAMLHYGDLATFDFDGLTRLVLMAHDYCYRVAVENGGPNRVKICIWKRSGREGQMALRHPAIETVLAEWRESHPVSGVS